FDQTAVDVDRPSGKRNRIDVPRIYDTDSDRDHSIGQTATKTLASVIKVAVGTAITDERQNTFGFASQLDTDFAILCNGEEIDAAADQRRSRSLRLPFCQEQQRSQQENSHGETF